METVTTPEIQDIEFSATAQQWLSQPKKILIDGQWWDAASGKTFAVYNPASGQEIVRVPEGEK